MRVVSADALVMKEIAPNVYLVDGEVIRNAPTFDAEPVVRCRECKHFYGEPGQPNIQCGQMHENDFCSYGERRDKCTT